MKQRGRRAASAVALSVLMLCSACTPVDSPQVQQNHTDTIQEGQAHTSDQLQAALEEFAQGQQDTLILNDEQLRESIPQAEAWLEGMEIDPTDCGLVLSAPLTEQLGHASMAALRLADSYITLAAYPDASKLDAQLEQEAERSDRCARYTVLRGNKRVAFHMAKQPVNTNARYSSAHLLTSSDGAGAMQQIMVRAAEGNLLITINRPLLKGKSTEQLAATAEEVNRLLALLED